MQKQWYTKRGNQVFDELCAELGVPFKRCGQFLVMPNRVWKPILFISQFLTRFNKFKDILIIRSDTLNIYEPTVSDKYHSALQLSSGGVVDPQALTLAYAENAVQNGVKFSFNTMVQSMIVENGTIRGVVTNRGTLVPKIVINAAGLFCEDIAAMAEDRFFSIHPIRGTGIVIDKKYADELVGTVISMQGKAGGKRRRRSNRNINSVMRAVDGTVLAGPFYVETISKEDYSTDRFSVDKAIEQAKHAIPAIEKSQVISYYSGMGAATFNGDFVICRGRSASNLIHAAGVQFPGLTASPAIAEDVGNMVIETFGGENYIQTNPDFNPNRSVSPVLKNMDLIEREQLIDINPDYGIIVCHCEQISRGEIVDALNMNVRCNSIDGVRRRTRACGGSCRGQGCAAAVLDIIATEKNIPPQQVRERGSGSEIVFGDTATFAIEADEKRRKKDKKGEDEVEDLVSEAPPDSKLAAVQSIKELHENDAGSK